ncbi:hypothetical protein JCM1841_002404 [Sporobolomyces salmonicolor]
MARFEELPAHTAATSTHSVSSALAPDSAPSSGVADPAGKRELEEDAGSDDDDDDDASIYWSPSELRDILERSTALKAKGNAEFGQGQWDLALGTYREALAELPVPSVTSSLKGKEKALPQDDKTAGEPSDTAEREANASQEMDEQAEKEELSELRSILSANVAACLLKLNRWKDAVKACDDALEEKPDYVKALHRRALANESIGSWSSLSAAQEDWNKLATLPGITPLLAQQVKQAQQRLPKLITVQQEKEKDEVLGKLKDLGNTVLGKFGLSLDNFKMQEQPGGGYSMNFQQ